tara:strand:+ start:166 stop:399 length:234 start_codon:yes stop_codon:yes gene_type:complete
MPDMEEFVNILRDVSVLARDRNETLKNSQYAEFALSDEALEKDIVKTASEKYKQISYRKFTDMHNKAFKGFKHIEMR